MLSNTMKRRTFLKGSLVAGGAGVALSLGLIPTVVIGAWPKSAFKSKDVNGALNGVLNASDTVASDKIKIKAPKIAENGAVVPVTVSTDLANVESITILTSGNVNPMAAHFNLSSNTLPTVSTRVKMAKTSDIIGVIKADGKLFSAKKSVKVTIGGCGG